MSRIVIIGWYGTETIGDRAILGGLLSLFSDVFNDYEVKIGTFYPVLTERTLLADTDFFHRLAEGKMKSISQFDSSRIPELNSAIKWSDMVIVGGGPIVDIGQMYMLEYTFARAKKQRKKTALLGCGIGPLNIPKIITAFKRMLKNTDLRILRDDNLTTLGAGFAHEKYSQSCDPAIFAAIKFMNANTDGTRTRDFVCVNFREIVPGVHESLHREYLKNSFISLLNNLLQVTDLPIHLIPMHTFYVGGDDRYTMNELAQEIKSDKIFVQNKPLSLEETISVYYNAQFCIGMRFHAVLLQTILNGKNYILDYTEPSKGKTIKFLEQFNLVNVYRDRYASLIASDSCLLPFNPDCPRINIDDKLFAEARSVYYEGLTSFIH